jgi:predicted porin
MVIKKKLLGVLALGTLASTAHADDGNSVTLYGVLDAAVGVVEHSADASAQFPASVNPVNKVSTAYRHSVWGMYNGGISDSRWGLRGTENLGSGLHAFFDLESGINLPSGNLNNAAGSLAGNSNTMAAPSALNGHLFNRGAFVGLKDDTYGALAFGRTPTLGLDTIANYDPVFAAQLFSPLGFSGSYSAGGITEGSRTDNNVKYTNHIGPFNVGLSYGFGGQAGNFGYGSSWGANLGYENGGFGVQAVWYSARDVLHSGSLVGANAAGSDLIGTNVGKLTLNNDEDVLLAAKYGFGPFTVKGGYEHYELKAPTDPAGAGATADYFGYAGSVSNTVYTSRNNVYFFGGDYKITPAFDVALGFYDTQTMQATGVAGGNQLQYSVLADYHLSRRTDVYAGYMFSKFNGAAFNGYESTNYIAAAGLRTAF